MLGMGSCLEVWDKQRYQAQEAKTCPNRRRPPERSALLMHSGGEWQHTTVLLAEAIESLLTTPDGVYVDGTFGRGGHSRALLARLSPRGRLIAFDRDPEAVARRARRSPMRASPSSTRPSPN